MTRRLMPYTQEEMADELQWKKDRDDELVLKIEYGKGPYKEAFPLIPIAKEKEMDPLKNVLNSPHPVEAMLDALAEALRDDMESGAAWMNEAATTEFEKKYPRFVMLFNNARRIDWSKTN